MTLLDHFGLNYQGKKVTCISGTHDDKDPSMAVYQDHVYCFSCGMHKWADQIDSKLKIAKAEYEDLKVENDYTDFMKQTVELPPKAIEVMKSKGITRATAETLRIRWNERAPNGIVFPYIYRLDGTIVPAFYRIRLLEGNTRFLSPSGGKTLPYLLPNNSDYTYITEGETDAITLWQWGLDVIGIPGANQKRAIKFAVKQARKKLIIVPDNDTNGQGENMVDYIKHVCRDIHSYEPEVVLLKNYKDINDYHTSREGKEWYDHDELFDIESAPVADLKNIQEVFGL